MARIRVSVFLVLCTLALFASVNVFGKTPDGRTPAQETICDAEQGSAKGLCNAYCEAMDCTDPNQRASDTGCAAVKANYERKTGRPFLPCEVGCPCIDQLQIFADIVSGATPVEQCIADASALYLVLENGEFAAIVDGLPSFCSANGQPPFITLTPAET
ncbi:MAG TPA: hypothetical protein VF111_15350, partial [Thermoanaerobaculia bacterium]